MITLSHRISRTAISRRSLLAATGGALLGAAAGVRLPAVGGASQNGESSDEAVADLLSLVPPDLVTFDGILFSFADVKRQLDALGKPMPEMVDDVPQLDASFNQQVMGLPLIPMAYRYAGDTEWVKTFGFSAIAAHRMLMFGEPPNQMTIFSGGIDTEAVATALERSGYSEVGLDSGESFWRFGDGMSIDLTSPVSRLGMGSVNNAVLLEDGVVFAYQPGAIQPVSLIRTGQAPSALEYPGLESFLATFSDDLVGLMPVSGATVGLGDPASVLLEGGTPDIEPSGDSSQIRFLAFGLRAGAMDGSMSTSSDATPAAGDGLETSQAKIEARLLMRSANAAERAATEIPERWDRGISIVTDEPFRELMTVDRSGVSYDNPMVAEIDFSSEFGRLPWNLIYSRDLDAFQLNIGEE